MARKVLVCFTERVAHTLGNHDQSSPHTDMDYLVSFSRWFSFPHRIESLFSLQYLCKLLVRSISSPTNAATLDSTGSGPDAKRREYVPPATCAIVHGQLGEKDQAFEWLGKAYEARLPSLVFIAVDEALDPLRDDPRFHDLLRRMNLEP